MKRFLLFNALVFILGVHLVSAQYNRGIIFSNEGNFGTPNASVSYFDFSTHQLVNGIYNQVNEETVGDVLQNIGFYKDKAYLVVNNSNKIEVVNRISFEKIATITDGINQPRYLTFSNDKYFVTNSVSKEITVYDIRSNEKLANISSNNMPVEQIVSVGNKVFVMLASWGNGNSIMVIDAVNNTATNTITINEGLRSITTYNNKVYALCATDTHSDIYEINTNNETITKTWSTDNYAANFKMTICEDIVYYVANTNEIYAMPISATAMPTTPILTVSNNGFSTCYGFNVIDGIMLIADAQGFTAPSLTNAYVMPSGSTMGVALEGGIGTNGFYANTYSNESVEELTLSKHIQIYPNPVQDEFTIKGITKGLVKIHDINGKLCKSIAYTEGQLINVSDLQKGIYLIACHADQGVAIEKLFVE